MATAQHLGYPWVMHIMDAVPKVLCTLPFRVRPEVGQAFSRVLRGHYLCCSQTVLDEIVSGGVPIADQARVIPNWVTTAGSPGRTEYRPGGRMRVVSAGSISVNKGMDVLIRAAGLLRDRGRNDFSVDVYGPCHDPFFPALVKQLDLEDRVRLCGVRTQAELIELYPTYDVFAFPTWEREPMAFAPMEAAAHGCAVVMSRVCGNSEWFVDGLDCVKADRTPEGFASALEALATGQLSLPEIARRGMNTILRSFRLDKIIDQIQRELALAAAAPPPATVAPPDAYRLALLAEKTFHALIQETVAA
jgi:glycosyltransferase involved in cell wall biosynthesis